MREDVKNKIDSCTKREKTFLKHDGDRPYFGARIKSVKITPKRIVFLLLFFILPTTAYYLLSAIYFASAFTGPSSSAGSGSGAISVSASGNIGIGTVSPTQKLTVVGTIESTSGGFKFPDGTTQNTASGAASTLSSGNISSGQFGANTGGGNYSFPASLGIGISTPARPLHVLGTIPLRLERTGENYIDVAFSGGAVTGDAIDFQFQPGSAESLGYQFQTYNAGWINALNINKSGYVGIGTTNPGQKLDVAGTIRQSGATNCNLATNASGDIGCQSDERLKDVKGNYISGLNVIIGMNPIRFTYSGESYVHVGFSAQNVQTVLKEATPLQHNGYFGLDATAITAALVNAMKELNAVVVKMKDGIAYIGHLTTDLIETSGLKANLVESPKIIVNEFEMKDSVTGDTYCVTLQNGDLVKTKGKCPN